MSPSNSLAPSSPPGRRDGYAPIGDYGLVADGDGAVLVCSDGRVDWMAVPTVDTAPFLASILDAACGGFLHIAPTVEYRTHRKYLEGTMVLETIFETDGGILRVTDSLNQGIEGRLPWTELARCIEAESGAVPVRFELRPGTRLGTVQPWVHERDGVPYVLSGDLLAALVLEGLGEAVVEPDRVWGEAVVQPGAPTLLALVLAKDSPVTVPRSSDVRRRLGYSVGQWRSWSDCVDYDGPYRDEVVRSALTIKALSDRDTGAVAAAPTTSLPEVIGSSRNFDYRFCWVRDTAFMIDALTRLHLTEQVDSSLSWLLSCVQQTAPVVRVLYTLGGDVASGAMEERGELEGYKGSAPVVTGNRAASQVQHGSYGDLLGAVSRFVDGGGRLDTETGIVVCGLVDELCDRWPLPDAGIWELTRSERYTSSLINSWTALDRACRLAGNGELPSFHLPRWEAARQAVHAFADEHCWSESKSAYTFYAGTDELDAAVLLAARTGFLSGDDERLWTTIDAVRAELSADGPLVFRYSGARREENAFVACTFWLIEALCHAGRLTEAGELLEGALAYSNDLGLWSEEIDPTSRELLGNFPIGISHLSVIGAITTYQAARKGELARPGYSPSARQQPGRPAS